MSDILPVCMQDVLYSRKSELREQITENQMESGTSYGGLIGNEIQFSPHSMSG